jgi:redox-sensitive bicupin YhaK (pirin superfamily)
MKKASHGKYRLRTPFSPRSPLASESKPAFNPGMSTDSRPEIELVIPTREATLAGGLTVKRILPFRLRRSVGPFVFLDEMGPVIAPSDGSCDVPPHPHIGLSTVTYLFEGEMLHRDSLGSLQKIKPGDVNWMTAGEGIVHSERIPVGQPSGARMHGLQAWVALPLEDEETAPSFFHHAKESLPDFERDGVRIHLIAGTALGEKAPVRTHSALFYFTAKIPAGKTLRFRPEDPGMESGLYLVSGGITIDSHSFEGKNAAFDASALLVFRAGEEIVITARVDACVALLGGTPHPEPRTIYWNFVSSSKQRIEEAKLAWKEGRFPPVPGETEFVPLPE